MGLPTAAAAFDIAIADAMAVTVYDGSRSSLAVVKGRSGHGHAIMDAQLCCLLIVEPSNSDEEAVEEKCPTLS